MSNQGSGYTAATTSYEVLHLTHSLFLSHDDDVIGVPVAGLPLAGGLTDSVLFQTSVLAKSADTT